MPSRIGVNVRQTRQMVWLPAMGGVRLTATRAEAQCASICRQSETDGEASIRFAGPSGYEGADHNGGRRQPGDRRDDGPTDVF